ncbi:EamA family transporter [Basfia succiniciproducens]|uniref:EamA family transporter n=1 Tax=Basfia succiniciproducens TaxID=653940 RepID=UPI003FCEE06E
MFYLIAAVLIWASAFIAAKFSYTMFDPALTVMLRLILSALLVLPTFFRSYRKSQNNTACNYGDWAC